MISEEYADEPQFRMAQKRWHSFLRFSLALVAQLDRASASEAEGCWFDSSRGHLITKDLRRIEKSFFRFGTESGTE